MVANPTQKYKLNDLPEGVRVFTAWDGADVKKNGPRQRANYHYFHRIRQYLAGVWPAPEPQQRYMHSSRDVMDWWMDAIDDKYVVLDTEYTYPGPKNVYMLGLYSPKAGVLQWENKPNYISDADLREFYIQLIAKERMVVQNYKADVPAMEDSFGVPYAAYLGGLDDTLLMHHVLWTELPHSLEYLESLHGKHEKAKHLQHVDELKYNAFDCITAGVVYENLLEEFEQEPGCAAVYHEELLRLIPIVLEMERAGIPVNADYVRDAFEDTSRRVSLAGELAHAYAGWPINLDSSNQVGTLLFQHEDCYGAARKMGARLRAKKTGKGALSISDEVVAALRQAFEPIDQDRDEDDWGYIEERVTDGNAHPLLESRAYHIRARQNRSSYLFPMVRSEHGPLTDGQRRDVAAHGDLGGYHILSRTYPSFNIAGQATGRWSTTDPPLAQLPKHYQGILNVDPDWPEFYWDWDQIELRLTTVDAGDAAYQEWFDNEWDPHTLAACDCLAIPYPPARTKVGVFESDESAAWREEYSVFDDDWAPRHFAKGFIYRLCYRGNPKFAGDVKGARQLGLNSRQLEIAAERWLDRHPAVRALWQRMDYEIATTRCIRNSFGRRRKLLSPDPDARIREGSNFPNQSVVGHLMNRHIIEVFEKTDGMCRPRWTKHDAVYWGVHHSIWEEGKQVIIDSASQTWDLGNGKTVRTPITYGERTANTKVAA